MTPAVIFSKPVSAPLPALSSAVAACCTAPVPSNRPGHQAQEEADGIGAGQIVLGSDYPYIWEMHPVDPIMATASLSDDQKADILGRTAARLLKFEA